MEDIKTVYLEAVLMPNGEILHYGNSLGFVSKRQIELVHSGACKLTRGGEPVVGIGEDA